MMITNKNTPLTDGEMFTILQECIKHENCSTCPYTDGDTACRLLKVDKVLDLTVRSYSELEKIKSFSLVPLPLSNFETKTCSDCVCKEICDVYTDDGRSDTAPGDETICDLFKNKNLYIKLPFEVGKHIYTIADDFDSETPYVSQETVTDISTKGVWISGFNPAQDDCSFLVPWEDFGKDFFLTPEDAAKALEEKE